MNRSALPARMKYSCSVRTFPFAASLNLESSSDKRVSVGFEVTDEAVGGKPCAGDSRVITRWHTHGPLANRISLVDLASRGPLGSPAMSRSLSRDRLLSLLEVASS